MEKRAYFIFLLIVFSFVFDIYALNSDPSKEKKIQKAEEHDTHAKAKMNTTFVVKQ